MARGVAQTRSLRAALARLTWPALFLGILVTLAVILPGHHRHAARQVGSDGSSGGGPTAADRQADRQRLGRAQRTYVKGETQS